MRRRGIHLHRPDGRRVPERRAHLVRGVRGGGGGQLRLLGDAIFGGQVGGKLGHVIVVGMVGCPW